MKLKMVAELYRELEIRQAKLAALKAATLQPARLEMPQSQSIAQPTERIAVEILALEEEITRLQEEIIGAKAELVILILDKVSSPTVAQILIRKYVRRETFQLIATEM